MDINNLNKCDKDGLFITKQYIFFFGSVFSNFHKAKFTYSAFNETHTFFCSEQAFMWIKAKTFDDNETAAAILHEDSDPMTCKSLGRMVQNYNDKIWDEMRWQAMYNVNFAKFTQNKELHDFITDKRFDGKIFVEASPIDCIWGIGRAIGDPIIINRRAWKGKNLLGGILTRVKRDILKSENIEHYEIDELKYRRNSMLTIKQLIVYLQQFNPDACICGFNAHCDSPWQAQIPENLSRLIHTAKQERDEYLANNQMSKDKLDIWLKYVEDDDVLIRF